MNIPRVWAHRGARSVAPENTMAAARAALAQGVFGWELDVHLSQDGHVVIIHDHGLRRTTDAGTRAVPRRQQVVSRLALDELRALDAGSWFARQDPFGTIADGTLSSLDLIGFAGESIPTLAEALAWSREVGLHVNVEIKDQLGGDDDGLVRATADLIRASGLGERVCVSSFRAASVGLFHALCPEIPVGLLLDTRAMQAPTERIMDMLRDLGATALHPAVRGLRPGLIREFTSSGFDVNVYTVNSPEDLAWLAREGATGVITDFPGRARDFYSRLG